MIGQDTTKSLTNFSSPAKASVPRMDLGNLRTLLVKSLAVSSKASILHAFISDIVSFRLAMG